MVQMTFATGIKIMLKGIIIFISDFTIERDIPTYYYTGINYIIQEEVYRMIIYNLMRSMYISFISISISYTFFISLEN